MPSPDPPQHFTFHQIHIDAARNATDDFNLFHDKNKWNRIQDNPFGGPIALGFQLECLIEYQMLRHRHKHGEDALIAEKGLRFSNYQFTFADAVRPGETISITINKSHLTDSGNLTLANRVALKKEQGLVLIGYKKESQQPLFLPETDLAPPPSLHQIPDRSHIGDSGYFLKRKFMNTGNAKNFLSGSLAEQADYFDELEDKVHFPEVFPVGLTSCALLEHARLAHHDFERDPMVYTSHKISVDREHLRRLKSNDVLHILIRRENAISGDKGLGSHGGANHVYHCLGITDESSVLFRAEIALTSLEEIIKAAHPTHG